MSRVDEIAKRLEACTLGFPDTKRLPSGATGVCGGCGRLVTEPTLAAHQATVVDALVAAEIREAGREGYRTARDDIMSGAFIYGPNYDALKASFAGRKAMAEAWDEGNRAGKSRAMRHMSDEPGLSLETPNPYRENR